MRGAGEVRDLPSRRPRLCGAVGARAGGGAAARPLRGGGRRVGRAVHPGAEISGDE